jgi:hypothetical protein
VAALALFSIVVCRTSALSQSLDTQEQCASQARKAFQELENENKSDANRQKALQLLSEELSGSNYQSHYNTKLNRCLILMTDFYHSSSDYPRQSQHGREEVTLVDANERREFASYGEKKLDEAKQEEWRTEKKISGQEIFCKLMPSIFQERTCKNREEFEAFVMKYMEE